VAQGHRQRRAVGQFGEAGGGGELAPGQPVARERRVERVTSPAPVPVDDGEAGQTEQGGDALRLLGQDHLVVVAGAREVAAGPRHVRRQGPDRRQVGRFPQHLAADRGGGLVVAGFEEEAGEGDAGARRRGSRHPPLHQGDRRGGITQRQREPGAFFQQPDRLPTAPFDLVQQGTDPVQLPRRPVPGDEGPEQFGRQVGDLGGVEFRAEGGGGPGPVGGGGSGLDRLGGTRWEEMGGHTGLQSGRNGDSIEV